MERHDDLMNKLFDRVSAGEIGKVDHANIAVWFIDDLSKQIQNIRETSLNKWDADTRITELASRSGITLSTLYRFLR